MNLLSRQKHADFALLKNSSISTREKLRVRILVEVCGGITRDNLASYVKTGVDVISVGSITHSSKAIDMSLELHLGLGR